MMVTANCDEFDVVICGCGPTGALLSALLGRLRVRHVVLEREADITTDPRGIVLDEDGIRTVQGLGLYENLFSDIGSPMSFFRFIEGGRGLHAKPFLQFDHTTIEGGTGHPGFMSQKQPVLEKHLRQGMDATYSELRSGSTVTNIKEEDGHVFVEYKTRNEDTCVVKGKFLVGADGKTGFTRKKYLEPKGILMEKSSEFHYEAIWVALNWHLTIPTPESHPKFPLWSLGYTPEEVYDLFFPVHFNFICDPARPSVCGRFGGKEDRLWRFEFVVKEGEDGHVMASKTEAKKVIFPYLTYPGKRFGLSEDVAWPEDCITWIRSRPFSFSARSCNKWALGRVILCGDAAHVFPPFGGQGIASGFRDAVSLSWRLKVAIDPKSTNHENLLRGWYVERKQQFERSLAATIENGNFCNEPSRVKAFFRNWYLWLIQLIPSWRHKLQLGSRRDGMTKYDWSPGLPFLPQFDGGKLLPQVFSAPIDGPAPSSLTFTDDSIFSKEKKGVFQIVVILDSVDQLPAARSELAGVVPPDSVTQLDPSEATFIFHNQRSSISENLAALGSKPQRKNLVRVLGAEEYTAAGVSSDAEGSKFARPPPIFYDPNRIRRDLGYEKRYIIVRYDRFVFASCKNIQELQDAVGLIEKTVNG